MSTRRTTHRSPRPAPRPSASAPPAGPAAFPPELPPFMLFAEVAGGPSPVAPLAADGTPRAADGRTYYTLRQAAERWGPHGWTEGALAELYAAAFDPAAIAGALQVLSLMLAWHAAQQKARVA